MRSAAEGDHLLAWGCLGAKLSWCRLPLVNGQSCVVASRLNCIPAYARHPQAHASFPTGGRLRNRGRLFNLAVATGGPAAVAGPGRRRAVGALRHRGDAAGAELRQDLRRVWGVFILMSVAWAQYFDGFRPDQPDVIGGLVVLVGVGIMLFWPRGVG